MAQATPRWASDRPRAQRQFCAGAQGLLLIDVTGSLGTATPATLGVRAATKAGRRSPCGLDWALLDCWLVS